MPSPIPKAPPVPKILRKVQRDWLKGYQSTLDDDRKDDAGLKISQNVVVEQNGTVRPRPSLVLYGTQPTGTVLGQVYPFIKMNGTTPENWEATMQNVAGVTKVAVRKDGGAWTICDGKTYDNSARTHFEQINSKLLVTNGTDNLSYLDIDTLAVVPFVALTTPTGLGAVKTGLAGTNYTYRYRVTAANQGETAAASAATVQVGQLRDVWAGGTTDFVSITFDRVTGAQRYSLYVGTEAGLEYYLDTITDPGSGTTVTYKDDGSVALNSNRLAPNGDSTAGPKTTRATNVLGQVYMVGDTENPYRLWFGGTGDSSLDFSAFNGGGWVEIDKGGRNFPVAIKGFRDGRGNPLVSVLLKGQSGHGKLIHAAQNTTTLGDTIISFLDITEANGEAGTDAPDAVIYAQDSLWYLSKDGPKTTGTKAQIQNILSTNNFGTQIQPDVKSLNVKSMEFACGLEYEGRLYFAIPVGSDTNNKVWVCDLNRNALWTLPWELSIDWLWLYDDNGGATHFMALSNNQIYEITYAQLTRDDQTPFATRVGSGIVKFSEDGQEWGSVIDITFVLLRPQGSLTFTITGKTQDEPIAPIGTGSFSPSQSFAGWNEGMWNEYSWNEIDNIPATFGEARVTQTIEIDEELNWLTWEVSSSDGGVDYQLSEVVVQYVNIGVIDTE